MSEVSEVKSVDLFEWLSERMIRKVEDQPIIVDLQLVGGTVTVEITKKHPWFKELNRQRTERLRTSFKSKLGR